MEVNIPNIISVVILELILCIGFVHILNKACDIAVENIKRLSKDLEEYQKNKGEI